MAEQMLNHPPAAQRLIGLTGGIGMGKTTVADYLATHYGFPVLDADHYARDAVKPGMPALSAIADRYGIGVLHPDGSLNRHRLGNIIFNSAAERLWVEQQIHPFVRDRFVQALHTPPLNNSLRFPTIILVIPLLFEARMTDLVTETWVVYCTEQQQLERLTHRDHLMEEQAQARVDSQMPIQRKLERADVVLDNSSTLNHLLQQIDQHVADAAPAVSATPPSSASTSSP